MKLSVPFYENSGDGKQCMRVAMKIALKHFLGKEYSLEELDKLTSRKPNCWTWTPQIVPVLQNLGLEVKYYTKIDPAPFVEGEKFLRRHYGKEAEGMLAQTDVPSLVKATKELLKHGLYEVKTPTLAQIRKHLEEGHLPLILVDSKKIAGKEGNYNGHFVVLTGFEGDDFFYHESGPTGAEPHKRVPSKRLLDAWNVKGTDNDLVVVYGRK